jgi:hypothetical protein
MHRLLAVLEKIPRANRGIQIEIGIGGQIQYRDDFEKQIDRSAAKHIRHPDRNANPDKIIVVVFSEFYPAADTVIEGKVDVFFMN